MLGAAATIAADGPAPMVYALVAVSAVAGTLFRPAKSALLPALVTSPGELTAANVASSALESVGMFLGPALGGALLAISSPSVVFAANGLAFLWSAALVFGLRAHEPARKRVARDPGQRVVSTLMAGISTIVHEPNLRTLVGLYGAQTLVAGAVNVLVVVAAFQLLDLDEAGVGLALRDARGRRPDRRLRRPRARRARPARAGLRDRARALRPPARADRRPADGRSSRWSRSRSSASGTRSST